MEKETALKILRELHDKALFSERTALETFIPELKESEDERIRKELLEYIKNNPAYPEGHIERTVLSRWAAWIEKQGEQKPVVIIPKFRPGDVIHLKNSCAEYTIKSISDGHYYGNGFSFNIVGCDRDYELIEQKPAEWNEEDEKERKRIIGLLEGWLSTFKETCYAEDCKCGIDWLKSIKDRIQPQITWKPSDEQMQVLQWCMPLWFEPKTKAVLESLIADLKKLKGE